MPNKKSPRGKPAALLQWSADSAFASGRDGREYMIQHENLDGAHGGRRAFAMWRSPEIARSINRVGGWERVPEAGYHRLTRSAQLDAERHEQSFPVKVIISRSLAVQVDTARLDRLGALSTPGIKWIARPSTSGRGYRVHQSRELGKYDTVREAIDAAIPGQPCESGLSRQTEHKLKTGDRLGYYGTGKEKLSLIDCIPANWLDPMLTGKLSALIGEAGQWGCPDVERLLQKIRERMTGHSFVTQLVDQAVSAVVGTKGWQVGGGNFSLRDQIEMAFASAGLMERPNKFEGHRPSYSGYKIAPGHRSVTVWEFEWKTNRRMGVHRCTPDRGLTKEQRVGVVRRFLREHNLSDLT